MIDKNLEEQLNIFKMKVLATIFSPEYELPIYEKHNSSEKKTDEEKKEFFNKIINKEEVELISNSNLLTEEQTNIVNRIAENFTTLTDKEQKKLKKHLTRLVIKKKPFKAGQFLEKNNISKINW